MTVTLNMSDRWHINRMGPVTYGLLYNWYAVDNVLGLAPTGWHIPSIAEMQTLNTYLGSGAGGKLKEVGYIHWTSPNTGATNATGFTALPSGTRLYTGVFSLYSYSAFYWSTTPSGIYIYYGILKHDTSTFGCTGFYDRKAYGWSIRCIRDTDVGWIAGEKVTDYDGNNYDTVQIDTQIWTVQNLAVTHYRDGTVIPEVTDNAAWAALITGALCAYNNDWNNVYF